MKWNTAPLDCIADVIRGVSFSAHESHDVEKANTIGVLRAGNIQEDLIVDTDLIYIPKKKVSHQQFVKANDIAMCTSSGSPKIVGKTAYSLCDTSRTVGAFCCIIRAKQDMTLPRYLFHFLNSAQFRKWTELSSGINIKNIKISELQNFNIPLPPPAEQRRIAAILDKADAIRRKRQQSLELADSLLKSLFLDMFGDPVTNPKGWEKGTIRDIVSDVSYGTSKPAADGGKYIYLRMNNITYGGSLDLTNVKHINATDSDLKKYSVRNGDVLFNRTNSKELVGKTCVFTENTGMIIAGYIIRVRVNSKAVPQYLSAILNSSYGKATLLGMCKSIIGQANINAQELQDIKILIPPVELQRKFANSVASIEVRKRKLNAHLAEADHAFKALQQSFFG